MTPLLAVRDLSVRFRRRGLPPVQALEGVSFDLGAGQSLGLVGESGSGKSVTALALAGLLDPSAQVTAGSVRLAGLELIGADAQQLRLVRGRRLAMIFQNPRRALNPVRRIGAQLEDALRAHGGHRPARQVRERALELLAQVGMANPARRWSVYPWELSGGQCQRVMIALALAGDPAVLVADEPTTGLDVATQAGVMDLLGSLARARGMATLLITHDLALAATRCEHIAVMHAGHLVEHAAAGTLFASPAHPYARQLIDATPRHGLDLQALRPVAGRVPDLGRADLPACRFAERCGSRTEACLARPPLVSLAPGHAVACWNPE